jgi:hypothetical protein
VQALWGASLPAFTARHCPVVEASWPFNSAVHALHPVHSFSQHTPSATTLEVHSMGCEAGWPLPFFTAQVLVVMLQ